MKVRRYPPILILWYVLGLVAVCGLLGAFVTWLPDDGKVIAGGMLFGLIGSVVVLGEVWTHYEICLVCKWLVHKEDAVPHACYIGIWTEVVVEHWGVGTECKKCAVERVFSGERPPGSNPVTEDVHFVPREF